MWFYEPCTDFLCPLRKPRHHFRLDLARLGLDIVVIDLWHGELQHIGGLDVRNLTEHLHQFWQVVELCKPCLCSVIRPLWGEFQSRDRFSERGSPTVKMLQSVPCEGVILQVPLHGIHLDHRVTYRRSCCENYATVARDFREGLSSVFVNFSEKSGKTSAVLDKHRKYAAENLRRIGY